MRLWASVEVASDTLLPQGMRCGGGAIVPRGGGRGLQILCYRNDCIVYGLWCIVMTPCLLFSSTPVAGAAVSPQPQGRRRSGPRRYAETYSFIIRPKDIELWGGWAASWCEDRSAALEYKPKSSHPTPARYLCSSSRSTPSSPVSLSLEFLPTFTPPPIL